MIRKKSFLGVLISAGMLYLVLGSINLTNLQAIIMDFGVEYFLLLSIINTAPFLFRALRWRIIVMPIARISILDSGRLLFVSYMVNNIVPAHLGELVRAFLLGKRTGAKFTSSMATVLIDRILDGVTMVALLVMVEPFSKSQLLYIHEALEVAGILIIAVLAFILRPAKRLVRLAGPLKALPSRWREELFSILKGLNISGQTLVSYPSNVLLLASSFATWLLEAFFFYLVMLRVGVDITFPAAVVVLLILNIGVLIPAAPGYIGTYEAFVIMGLLSFGADKTEAAAVALIAHAIQYISVAVFGTISLKTMGLGLEDILKIKRREV